MKRCEFTFLLTIVSFVSTLVGCSSTGVGNPGFTTQSLALISDDDIEPDASDNEQLDAAALSHAYLVVGEIHALPCDTSEDDTVVTGPFALDLIQNSVQPELPDIAWPSSGVCGLDAVLAPAQSPKLLAGRSMLFSGVREDGTLFILVADMPGTLRMRPLPGVMWEPEGHTWLWALRPRRWLRPSELDAEPSDTGSAAQAAAAVLGVDDVERIIAINVNRHPVLYEAIRTRLAERSTLHVDKNDNLKLDTPERSGEAWIGQGLDDIE